MLYAHSPSDFSSAFSDAPADAVESGFTDENICGSGASCVVYRLRSGDIQVAVKRLRAEFRSNPLYISSYRKEFKLGQRLRHDALPIYRELRADAGDVYIVMDYVDGTTLDEFISTEEGRAYFKSEENVRAFFVSLVSAVAYLHRSGVIHCDIKPSNIMLRHSDRGVMLIDLDKCYCDSFDRTHGGTRHSSDPMTDGATPTAQKDYNAIGSLVDVLSERIAGFPCRKFSRLRKLCCSDGSTSDELLKSLKKSGHLKPIITAALITAASIAALFVVKYNHAPADVTVTPAQSVESLPSSSNIKNDTVIMRKEMAPVKPVPFAVNDFDKRMEEFNTQAQNAIAHIQSGNMPDKKINDLNSTLLELYTDRYGAIIAGYKTQHPDVTPMEVEMAVAEASQRSKASSLLKQFTQAAADTIRLRHPDLFDNLD